MRATAMQLLRHLGRTRALGVAAEMAFWLFLSLLPLAAVAAYVAARLALHDWSLAAPLFAAMPADATHIIVAELGRVAAWNGGAVTPLAGAFFLWLASTGVHSIFDGFEAQTGATRSWIAKRLIALTCCVVLSFACGLVALLGSGLAWGARQVHDSGAAAGALLPQRVLEGLTGVGLLYLLIAGLYRVGIPRAVRRTMPLAPGTALVVLLHVALGFGYRIYVSTLGDGGAYLAGLAVVGVTMTTLYLFCTAILVGLGLNQVLGRQREAARSSRSAPGAIDAGTPHASSRDARLGGAGRDPR
jgi:membrane protein